VTAHGSWESLALESDSLRFRHSTFKTHRHASSLPLNRSESRLISRVFDKYQIVAQLGRGGMADVFLAATVGPGDFSKLLVIKMLRRRLAQSPNFVAMFRDEARLSAQLNHPNVIQIYEVGEDEGCPFIAMEYLEGQPLHRIPAGLRGLQDIGMALRIAIDALAGLHYAHELRDFEGFPLNVIHRDITPHNIFVGYEGQVKIVDFGIAKASGRSAQTEAGVVKGKIAYMAPEQAQGEPVARTADVFSMGVVLWELLAGRRLWEGLTDSAILARVAEGKILDLQAVRPELPDSLVRHVMRALAHDPDDRPESAAEFQRVLEMELERLAIRTTSRMLGEAVRQAFREERAEARAVIKKQLERFQQQVPVTMETGSWNFAERFGGTPVLGEGSRVHHDPTVVHAGQSAGGPGWAMLEGSAAATAALETKKLRTHAQRVTWVALIAVGMAGVGIGGVQPWSKVEGDDGERHALATSTAWPSDRGAKDARAEVRRSACDNPKKPRVELAGEIAKDARLTCDNDYVLRFTTFVLAGATLTIDAGTQILGDRATKATLVVQPGGKLNARGTADHPIVFTSIEEPERRRAGDWGGLILLGDAPTNLKDTAGVSVVGHIEGLTSGGEYGGADPDDSSGGLSYVRIEYSGTELGPNNEINGLTLGGVGRGTVLDHIQIRHTADDCFEFFGGTADAKYLLCQHPGDDALDWDYGYTGRIQFFASVSHPEAPHDSNGLEGDNDPNGSEAQPVSAPLIYNTTVCGKNRSKDGEEHYAILLRRGTGGRIRNGLFVGFDAGLDVRDSRTRPNIAASTFFQNALHNLAFPETPTAPRSTRSLFDDDNDFDEVIYLMNEGLRISQNDPHIGNCFDSYRPSYKPQVALTENAALPPSNGFLEPEALYVGAFRDKDDHWDEGAWTKWGE
jgi:serine/threonine protein kinase